MKIITQKSDLKFMKGIMINPRIIYPVFYCFFVFSFSSCSENRTNDQNKVRNKSVNTERSVNNDNLPAYTFKELIIEDWNHKTNDLINYYSINGNNENPMKIIWNFSNNGEYRGPVFDSLSKLFSTVKLSGTTLVKETFIRNKGPLSNTPKSIYIINTSAKFHVTITNFVYNNEMLNFDIDTTIKNEVYYEQIPKRFSDSPIILKVFKTFSDHSKDEIFDVYSGINDNGSTVLFDFEIVE